MKDFKALTKEELEKVTLSKEDADELRERIRKNPDDFVLTEFVPIQAILLNADDAQIKQLQSVKDLFPEIAFIKEKKGEKNYTPFFFVKCVIKKFGQTLETITPLQFTASMKINFNSKICLVDLDMLNPTIGSEVIKAADLQGLTPILQNPNYDKEAAIDRFSKRISGDYTPSHMSTNTDYTDDTANV